VTHAPRSPRLEFGDLEDVARALRAAGGRFSMPRRRVLEALFAAEGPVSAEYIAQGLGGRTATLEPASVYRALEYLEELGVVRHVHLGHGPGLYALTGEGEPEYLVCERCSRVVALDATALDPIRERIEREFGYRARFSHFPIVGVCAACAGEEEQRRVHEHSHGHYVHAHDHAAGEPHRHEVDRPER
jgi:Fur family transcriptional regulator, ferric uptake regulator